MTVHAFKRQKTLAPHELAELRDEQTDGLLVDDLTGPVGDAEWERACLADDRAVNASKNAGRWDAQRDRHALQEQINRGL